MTDRPTIRIARAGRVGILSLDRPERLNAYTPDMGDELVAAFRLLDADSDVGAIVITGTGRAFCAGADREFLDGRTGNNGKRIGEELFVAGFASELHALSTPTIAAVNGPAVGIGATMLLALDFRIAAHGASFAFPFARLGLMPGMGSTCLLPAIIGAARARDVLLAGATIDSERALALGLVSEVVADPDLLVRALALGATLAGHDAAALAGCKRALGQEGIERLRSAIAYERHETAQLGQNRRIAPCDRPERR